jgi:hypothetical protein
MGMRRIRDKAGNWFLIEKAKTGVYTIVDSNLLRDGFTMVVDVKNHVVEALVDMDKHSDSWSCFDYSEHVRLRNVEVDLTLGRALITAPNFIAIRSAFAWLTFTSYDNGEL